jgi:hypothetical protein
MSRQASVSRGLGVSAAAVLSAALLSIAALAQRPTAQDSAASSRVAANKVALRKFVDAANKLSPEVRRHLSRSMQNYLRYANSVVNGAAPAESLAAADFASKKKSAWSPWNLIPVSDPALDPATQGYTQNTSSSAWCGNTVVVGYEDSGAFLRTDPKDAFGVPISYNGVSYSENAGKNFTDLGFLTPGTFYANALLGEPVVTCSSPTHFQYASILNTTTPDSINPLPLIGPSVSFSTNGGKTWSAPLQVVSLDGSWQMADNPWLAVDPTETQRLYLSYTEIDALACNSINVVTSSDGGKKWSAPVIVDQECPPSDPTALQNTVAGSSITVGPDSKVYVAYEFFPGALPSGPLNNEIRFASSTNHSAAFSKPHRIGNLVPNGTGVELNGHLQVNEYPHIAVDRSHGPSRGTIYVTYPDGRDKVMADANSASGTYAYPDIFLAKSTNSGMSFSVPGAISRTPGDFSGVGRDQFLPGVAVDKDGEVAVCYYDRRNDRSDLRVDRFCSVSNNQGKTWASWQVSNLHWLPSSNADPLNPEGASYAISEYDTLTSDFMHHADGFFGAFVVEISGNQNVVATKF